MWHEFTLFPFLHTFCVCKYLPNHLWLKSTRTTRDYSLIQYAQTNTKQHQCISWIHRYLPTCIPIAKQVLCSELQCVCGFFFTEVNYFMQCQILHSKSHPPKISARVLSHSIHPDHDPLLLKAHFQRREGRLAAKPHLPLHSALCAAQMLVRACLHSAVTEGLFSYLDVCRLLPITELNGNHNTALSKA